MSHTSTIIPKILYVDDDQDDWLFLKESFAANMNASMVCASDGEEAIKYLDSVNNNELPSLIILDLNMPKWDGRETLKYLKSVPAFSKIPVVILSTSQSANDKEVCKTLGAISYFQKPNHIKGYKEIVKSCLPLINYNP